MDKLVETKGLDYVDKEKAKRHARQQAEQMYDQQHGGRDLSGGGGGNWGNVGQQYGIGGEQQNLLLNASSLPATCLACICIWYASSPSSV